MKVGMKKLAGVCLLFLVVGLVRAEVVDFTHLFDDFEGGTESAPRVSQTRVAPGTPDTILVSRLAELEEMVAVRDRQIAELKQALEDVTSEFSTRITEMRIQRGDEVSLELAELRIALKDAQTELARRDASSETVDTKHEAELQLLRNEIASHEEVKRAAVARLESEFVALRMEKEADLASLRKDLAAREEAQRVALQEQERALVLQHSAALAALEAEHKSALSVQQREFANFREETKREVAEAARLRNELARLEAALRVERTANERERFLLAYNSGSLFLAAGRYDRAEQEFLKALALRGDDAPLHYNIGILYDQHLRQPAKARMHYERFLELAPNDRDAPLVMQWLRELR